MPPAAWLAHQANIRPAAAPTALRRAVTLLNDSKRRRPATCRLYCLRPPVVIKSLSRRDPSIRPLLLYFSRDGTAAPPLLHNLPLPAAADLSAAAAAFEANAAHLPARKNGVAYYHEILSLSGCDRPQANPAMLLDLARRYLELRAPAALAYGRVHFEPGQQKNPHVHLAISGNLCGQPKKLRVSKARFRAIRQRYQQERYPQLTHSLVCPAEPPVSRARDGRAEQERQRRQGRGSSGFATCTRRSGWRRFPNAIFGSACRCRAWSPTSAPAAWPG